jgi:hypothetical protein
MTLTSGERTAVASSVWISGTRTLTSVVLDAGSLTASVIGSGYLAAISGQVNTDLSTAHGAGSWANVTVATGGIAASALTAGAIAAIQAGLATSAEVVAVPGEVWDVLTSQHTIIGSTGEALAAAAASGSPSTIAAAVWAASEGAPAAGTMGAAQVLQRRFITNKLWEAPGNPGTMVLYADNGTTPLLTWQLRDFNGSSVFSMAGEPARREAAT